MRIFILLKCNWSYFGNKDKTLITITVGTNLNLNEREMLFTLSNKRILPQVVMLDY